jgi:hypothetical protein
MFRGYRRVVTPLLVALALLAVVGVWIVVVRRRSATRIEVSTPVVLDESALTAIDRVEEAAKRIRGYAVERRDRELVVYRRHEGPLSFFETPEAIGAESYLDLLHVTAERIDGHTWVWLKGRSEPRVIARVRRALVP